MLVSSTIARADARRRSPQFETHRSFGDDEQSAAVMIRSISYYSRVRRGKKYVARYDIEAVGDGEHNFLARNNLARGRNGNDCNDRFLLSVWICPAGGV